MEPIDNGWDTLVRTHQGEKQVKHAALLLYIERLARERNRVARELHDSVNQ